MMLKGGLLTATLIFALIAAPAHAAPGDLDLSFGGDGIANGPRGQAYAVALQRDGKVFAAGCTTYCATGGEVGDFTLTRFTQGGEVDTSFAAGGTATTSFGQSDQAHALALQPDGKIVAAGCTGCDWFGESDFALARYNPDGTLDGSFGSAGKVQTDLWPLGIGAIDVAYGVVVQPDGKIVAGGFSNGDFALARYNPNGSVDQSFGLLGTAKVGFGGPDAGFALALQSDGKIVLAGDAEDADGLGDAAVARFLPNGDLDSSFSGDGKATIDFDASYRAVQGLALQADGKIVVAGVASRVTSSNHSEHDFGLGRFTASGSPDPTFGNGGKVVTDFGSAELERNDIAGGVTVQDDGKIVAAGHSYGGLGADVRRNAALARYTPNGALDPGFGSGGRLLSIASDQLNDVGLQSDGKLLVAGNAAAGPFAVIRFLLLSPPPSQCADGEDNDGEGKTDFGGQKPDPGCESADDDTESPNPPSLTGINPPSPSNDNNPRVIGSADANTTVKLYDNPGCTGATLASGSAAQLASPGITTFVPPDRTTTIYASASDAASYVSGCSTTPLAYIEDSTAPETAITSGPPETTASSSASFGFATTEPGMGSRFECKLDSGSWAGCSSPKELTGIAQGSHSFSVRATDAAGNTDTSEAIRIWRVNSPSSTPPGSTPGPGTSAPPGAPARPVATPPPLERVAAVLGADLRRVVRDLRRLGIGKMVRRRGFRARELDALLAGRLSVTLTGTPRGAGVAREVVLARGSRSVSAAGRYACKVKLTGAGRRLLGSYRRAKVTLAVSFRDVLGRSTTKRKALRLLR